MSGQACPHCGMIIYDEEALLCHFCGESLGRPSKGLIGQMRYSYRTPWILIVFFLVVMFILMTILF